MNLVRLQGYVKKKKNERENFRSRFVSVVIGTLTPLRGKQSLALAASGGFTAASALAALSKLEKESSSSDADMTINHR